ncbi:MAG: lipid II flippase MurJ, partial [Pseudomonadota bacterium]
QGQRAAYSRAFEFSWLLTIPSAVGLAVLSIPIISILFQRGAFGVDDTAATALALTIYALGLPAFVLQKVLQPLYFAREDTKTPLRYALVALVVNAVVAIGLSFLIGWPAAALGTTIAAWAMVILLWRGARRLGEVATLDARAKTRIWRVILAALGMGVVLWFTVLVWGPVLGGPWRALGLVALVLTGVVWFFGLAFLFRAVRWAELRVAFRRQR